MSSAEDEDVHVGGVGRPSVSLTDRATRKVHFHNFSELSTTELVMSPQFSCLGYDWKLRIHPGGDGGASDGFCSVFLCNCTNRSIEVEFTFIVKISSVPSFTMTGGTHLLPPKSNLGFKDFAPRTFLLNNLKEGTLTIEVNIRTTKQHIPTVVPPNPTLSNLINELGNEDTSDVEFTVVGITGNASNRQKQDKTKKNTFHAHHFVLRLNAPALADMCLRGDSNTVVIANVDPDAFKHMLTYCYGGKVSNEDLSSKAKEIIEVADRFGVVNLKLEAEAAYIKNTELTVDNVRDELLLADAMNLALLKEYAIDYIAENGEDVLAKVSFEDLPGNLLKDLLAATSRITASLRNAGKGGSPNPQDKFTLMRVWQLRSCLLEKGLCTDGSRETMIARLKDDEDNAEGEEKE